MKKLLPALLVSLLALGVSAQATAAVSKPRSHSVQASTAAPHAKTAKAVKKTKKAGAKKTAGKKTKKAKRTA